MSTYNIMAVIIGHRSKKAPDVQDILTKNGCIIKMRLGLHETGDACSDEGLVLLQLSGSGDEMKKLEDELNAVEGVTARHMDISSDEQA